MKNSELQNLLASYPGDMDVKYSLENREIVDYSGESILISSETAYIDDEAPEEDWDTEDGQIKLGDGKQFLLLNAIIV